MGKMKDTGLRTLFGSYCSVVLSDNDRIVYKTPPQGTADSKVTVLSRSHGIIYRVAHLLRERIMLTAIRQLRMGGLEEFNMY